MRISAVIIDRVTHAGQVEGKESDEERYKKIYIIYYINIFE